MAEGILFSFLGKISEYLVAPIGRQFGYVFCYNGNIKKLISQIEKLDAKREGVKMLMDAAENNCQVVLPEVMLWLNCVQEKREEANLLVLEKENIGKGCFNEWCLYFKPRYSLSKKATKRTQDLVVLFDEGVFQMIAYPPPPLGKVHTSVADNMQSGATSNTTSVPDLAIASTSTSSSEGFQSRLSILGNVMEAVKDDNIRIIGICGMGGVGKTTMVEEVSERAKKEHLFGEIVMTVVTQEPDEKRIQRGIADFLNLELKEDDLLARASRLHQRLSQKGSDGKGKKILIILDDLWKKLDLKKVGIPFGDDHSGCKIVLTSRGRDVCVHMKADKIFSIPVLEDDEAWTLFKNSLHTTKLYPVGEAIVKECGGLPIAVTIIAMVLAEKGVDTWNYVLGQLKRSALKGDYADVYKVFQVSYDHINHEEIKDVFLLCCLFPEDSDIPIEDLVRYGMGLRVFKNVDKLHEARDGAHAHVEVLKNLNLLLDSKEEECIKMHDLVRDFGLSIAAGGNFMVRFDKGVKEWPVENICEGYSSISMQCDEMDELPNGLKYAELKLLQLSCSGREPRPFKFPERLDEVMPTLQVLSLKRMSVPSLLGSVERLTNLRTLSLCGCALKGDVSKIGNVGQLEILSLVDSDISELPREIRNLRWLRLLDLTRCNKLKKVAPGVLSSLSRLEELYMKGTSIRWAEEIHATVNEDHEDGREVDDEGSYARLTELKDLRNLFAIDIDIPYKFLPVDLNLENLKIFKISIGNEELDPLVGEIFLNTLLQTTSFCYFFPDSMSERTSFQNTLCLESDEFFPLRSVLKALCRKAEILFVKVNDLKNLGNEIVGEELIRLKFVVFRSCDELVSVFDGVDQSFNVHSSSSLVLPPLGNLRHIELTECSKLKRVFSVSIAKGLFNLESMEIADCSQIEEIISKERGDNQDEKEAIVFLKLKILHFSNLPNLICFCKAVDHEVMLPQLKKMELLGLPKLTSLYPEMQTSADLDGNHGSSTKHPFFHQKIISENNLNTVFPENEIKQLKNLENIEVTEWNQVEVVFDLEPFNINEGHDELEALPQLQMVELRELPKLRHVWRNIPCQIRGFQNLRKLDVMTCNSLRHLLTTSLAKVLVALEWLRVNDCENMEAIVAEEEGEEEESAMQQLVLFPRLTYLDLIDLPKLSKIVPKAYTLNSSSLEILCMKDSVKGAATWTSALGEGDIGQQVTLTNLKGLSVKGMENMTTVIPENVIPQLQSLRDIYVQSCVKVEVVFDLETFNINEGHDELEALPQLQMVELRELPKLRHVWRKVPHQIRGFQNLRRLDVITCNSLRHLLTTSLAKVLVGLECVEVYDCDNMEAIVAEEEGEEEESAMQQLVLFPRLTYLVLEGLPKLSKIMPRAYTLNSSSLETLCMQDSVKGAETWTSALGEGDIGQQVTLTNLRELIVRGMENMTTVFPENVIPQLQSLQNIYVESCVKVEVVFDLQGSNLNEGHHQAKAFSQLNGIDLRRLPKLTSVWKNAPRLIQGSQNLKKLYVVKCDSLRHLLTPSMAKTLVSLERLLVESCESLEAIVAEEEGEEEKEEEEEFPTEEAILFPKLERLRLKKVPNLLTVLPKPYSFNWSSLKIIDVDEEKSPLLRRPKEISDSSTDVSQQSGSAGPGENNSEDEYLNHLDSDTD